MAKRFKLRFSRVFQSCRSKDPSTLPQHPVPLLFKISATSSDETAVVQHRSSFNRHVSSAFSTLGCGFGCSRSLRRRSQSLDFHWENEEQWHVVTTIHDETPRRKIYNSSVSCDSDDEDGSSMILPSLLPLPLPSSGRKKRRAKKKNYKYRHRMSTSSAESGLFSSESFDEREDEELKEETETLISSNFSTTDSSTDFNSQLETIRETTSSIPRRHRKNRHSYNDKTKQKTKNSLVPKVGMTLCRSSSATSTECASPARLSVFKKLIPGNVVGGKVKESFAVVKKSEDPLQDFKRSMMEMIMEKEMFQERELEELLQCFLSLNSRYHHRVIVEAFTEIWITIFGTATK